MSTTLLTLEEPVPPVEYTRLASVSFPTIRLEAGMTYALTGPNGSGKSTLMKMIAGVLSSGVQQPRLAKDARALLVPTELHQLLMPWHSIATNLSVLLRRQDGQRTKNPKEDKEAGALAIARSVLPYSKLDECLANRPGQLSSGQRAAVCLGIALELNCEVLLLDETLSNLSAQGVDNTMRLLLARGERGQCTLLTTHSRGLVNDYALQEIRLN